MNEIKNTLLGNGGVIIQQGGNRIFFPIKEDGILVPNWHATRTRFKCGGKIIYPHTFFGKSEKYLPVTYCLKGGFWLSSFQTNGNNPKLVPAYLATLISNQFGLQPLYHSVTTQDLVVVPEIDLGTTYKEFEEAYKPYFTDIYNHIIVIDGTLKRATGQYQGVWEENK